MDEMAARKRQTLMDDFVTTNSVDNKKVKKEEKPVVVHDFVEKVKQLVQIFFIARSCDRHVAKRMIYKLSYEDREPLLKTLNFVNYHFHVERYYKTAIDEFRHDYLQLEFPELLKDAWQWIEKRGSNYYLSLKESHDLILDWLYFHNFNEERFIRDLYNVLSGKSGKHNTFFVYGSPNGGKTRIFSEPIETIMATVGRIVNINTGDRFVFENCCNQRLISIEECAIPIQHIEEMKKLMGGEPVQVDVKNQREGTLILKTPVICSSNSEPWKLDETTKEALMARMYYYTTNGSFEKLRNYIGRQIDPRAWILMFVGFIIDADYFDYELIKKETETYFQNLL